ncbi:MAG: pyruvate carboxylase [Candidatus Nitricoxidivorans perseverans]|uniref:Pyruvate carboxylase n=1 Tax=Candidatus Nitricoxidivorans perseverans TaxID=2975601 RepID=A0AA49IVV6_9PROT|nr:MAG: pyruvate carboxylase [Candidatus Nitricoxidivorans perseverans]
MKQIRSLLVANRSEIAIRILRAASEMGIRTVAIFSSEDRFALHRLKADESYRVGAGKKPIQAYLDIDDIVRVAKEARVDAIHPGYGFLSENPDFAEACERAGIAFIGPDAEVMRLLGNKVSARELAQKAGVPVMPATGALPADLDEVKRQAAAIGYPLMLKASWGGGGRGMRVIETEADLAPMIEVARREALAAFGNDEVYLEKLVRRARHIEVQVMGDTHGNLVHLFERDCSVQRRNQKVVERAPAPYLSHANRVELCESALRLARAANYTHAGTVEFLMDADTGRFYFIEVNPRIQVEHTVTEAVTGADIVKAQIRITEGARIGDPDSFVPRQEDVRLAGHAIQCRVTTEDPENNFTPDYGRIGMYRSAAGFGIRLDAGTAYTGAVILPYYDSLLVKVTAWGHTPDEAAVRMDRALREFRIRGLSSNLLFLENVIEHPLFRSGECTTRFIDETPELFKLKKRRDRASRLMNFLAEVTVNGNPEMKGRARPALPMAQPIKPRCDLSAPLPPGTRDRLLQLGAAGFADWMRNEKRVLLTDTTMRDAHQSLFATRMRTHDMLEIAPHYARMLPGLFSLECWGGATFDVAMRFLKEDPWQRLAQLREAVPNIMLQMLLRASNAVGYTNYADNVVRYFVQQAAKEGIDVFRVFDSLNWVDNMRVAMDAVIESGALCEAAICYTGDIFDKARPKYNLKYYVNLAKQLEKAGTHILGIKDMAGVCRPRAAAELVRVLKQEIGVPIHFHTHDTSGISAASVLAAVEAGADAVDGALDAMSGLTSQPNLGSIAAALAGSGRDPGMDPDAMQALSHYWEGVRRTYAPFEADIRSGTADVYRHEMPGGQYTNLREQARAIGIEHRWADISRAYADVNLLFGDIVKVTPTSKVVGDMALFMVANNLTPEDVTDPVREIAFPDSVISLMRGELGFPPDGFPSALQKKVLKGAPPLSGRAGDSMPPVDLEARRAEGETAVGRKLTDTDLASYLMYPKVFKDYAAHHARYGDVSVLPTPAFFYGLQDHEEIAVELERGKSPIISLQGTAGPDEEGHVKVFLELNGQSRLIRVPKAGLATVKTRLKAEDGNPMHLGAPMPGAVVTVAVHTGQKVEKGAPLVSIEAMKMESMLTAEREAVVKAVHVRPGESVEAKDLLLEFA